MTRSLRFAASFGLIFFVGFKAVAKPPKTAAPSPPHNAAPTVANLSPDRLGVIIFRPLVDEGTDPATINFVAGCISYLTFTVQGDPHFGQTPLYSTVRRAAEELALSNDLRYTPIDARRVARIAGATHVVTSTLSGGRGKPIHVTFQLLGVDDGKVVGTSLVLSGDENEIRAGIPRLARQLDARLGVMEPVVPETVELTNDELRSVGTAAGLRIPPPDVVAALTSAGNHSGYAELLSLSVQPNKLEVLADEKRLLTSMAPQNTQAWSFCAQIAPDGLSASRTQLTALRKTYPHNAVLAFAEMMMHRNAGEHDAELKCAEETCANAPRNSDFPLDLYTTLSDRSSAIRRGRTMNFVTEGEMQEIMPLYERATTACRRASELDPLNGFAWSDLAVAATFSGDSQLARTAYKNGVHYSRNRYRVYEWGLQMFQAKWGGTPEELAAVAEEIAADRTFAEPADAAHFSSLLLGVGFKELAMSLHNAYYQPIDKRAHDNPNDGKAHWEKADFLWGEFRPQDAINEYKRATELLPNDPALWNAYGDALRISGHVVDSLPAYQKVIALDPNYHDAKLYLGFALLYHGDTEEAIKVTKAGIEGDPTSAIGHFTLAELYLNLNKPVDAIPEYRSAFQYGWRQPFMCGRYCAALSATGQAAEGIRFGKRAVSLFDPGGGFNSGWPAFDLAIMRCGLAHCYSAEKRYPEAEIEFQLAVQLSPDSSTVRNQFGDCLNEMGKRTEARTEWQFVIDKPGPADEKEHAAKQLAAFPAR